MAVSAVASAATSTSLLTASTRTRRKFIIENSDANRLYVLLDSGTASTSNYSFSLAQYENAEVNTYSGAVKGIWASDGTGHALITEFV